MGNPILGSGYLALARHPEPRTPTLTHRLRRRLVSALPGREPEATSIPVFGYRLGHAGLA